MASQKNIYIANLKSSNTYFVFQETFQSIRGMVMLFRRIKISLEISIYKS